MSNVSLLENKIQEQSPSCKHQKAMTGTVPVDSPSFQRLLDVISSILAEEYIMIAKQNPSVFLNNTPRLSELRGCAPSGQGDVK